MKKSDLENGMVVETRSMGNFLVVGELLMGAPNSGFNELCEYEDDLTVMGMPEFDIVRVFNEIYYIEQITNTTSLELV